MFKLRKKILTLSLSMTAFIPTLAVADIFHLSDGTTLKGSIVMEKGDEYILKVEIAENILAEKTVKKSLIDKIVKDDKSIPAFKKITDYLPLPDYLTVKDYKRFESEYLQKFRDKYPNSSHLKEVNQVSANRKEEITHLQSGGFKIAGKRVTKEQYLKNKFEYDASLKLRSLKRAAKNKQYTYAMQTFEKLEAGYSHTETFRTAVSIVKDFLPKYKTSTTKLAADVENQLAKRARVLDSLPESDKARTARLLEKETSKYEQALANAENELKTKWLPLNKFYQEPANKVLSNISSEENRLGKLRYDITKDAALYYREFLKAIEAKDPKMASK